MIGPARRWTALVHSLVSVYAPLPATVGVVAEPTLVEGVPYDVTHRKRAEHEVRRHAEHDTLSGLLNRRGSEAAICLPPLVFPEFAESHRAAPFIL